MNSPSKRKGSSFIVIATAILGLVAAGLVVATRYFELRKARAEANRPIDLPTSKTTDSKLHKEPADNKTMPAKAAVEAKPQLQPAVQNPNVVPLDVQTTLCGKWRFTLDGPNDKGMFHLVVICTFRADLIAFCDTTGTPGSWSYDPVTKTVRVDWQNGSWEILPCPLNTRGTVGQTANGPNIRVLAVKTGS